VWSVAFTPDGHGLVSGSSDGRLKHWDVSRLANGPGVRSDSPGPSRRGTLGREKDADAREDNSTMNFIGHKVRVELADWGYV